MDRRAGDDGCQVSGFSRTVTRNAEQSPYSSHISPFVFTRELLPILKKTAEEPDADVRIVIVSSQSVTHQTSSNAARLQLASKGHRFLSSNFRFQNLEDLNVDLSSCRFPELTRYCKYHFLVSVAEGE
jgi:hypothetical protein